MFRGWKTLLPKEATSVEHKVHSKNSIQKARTNNMKWKHDRCIWTMNGTAPPRNLRQGSEWLLQTQIPFTSWTVFRTIIVMRKKFNPATAELWICTVRPLHYRTTSSIALFIFTQERTVRGAIRYFKRAWYPIRSLQSYNMCIDPIRKTKLCIKNNFVSGGRLYARVRSKAHVNAFISY